MQLVASLLDVVRRCGSDGAGPWLTDTLASLDASNERAVRIALARCARRVGAGAPAALDLVGLHPAVTSDWTLVDLARASLVLTVLEALDGPAGAAWFDQLARRGEQGEQESLFKMLGLLPDPERFVATAVEGCRSNSEVVFGAIAIRNPFPAAHFPEPNFNQLVLKAIFIGLPVSEIEGLAPRVNGELVRMANDFAAERRAAGRPVPSDIPLLERLWENR